MSKAKQKQPAVPVGIIIGKSKPKIQQPLVHAAKAKPKAQPATVVDASISKLDTIITLLKRPKGATLEEMMQATGWQRHSVYGTLSGAIKKKRGLPLITEFGERGRSYRIAA